MPFFHSRGNTFLEVRTESNVGRRVWPWVGANGITPNYLVALAVVGRSSGRMLRFPVVMAWVDRLRYLVAMRGNDARCVHDRTSQSIRPRSNRSDRAAGRISQDRQRVSSLQSEGRCIAVVVTSIGQRLGGTSFRNRRSSGR